MTQEEKAKAYDEAFGRAQKLYNDPNSSNVGKGYVCTVFPELKESKSEKIRKELINYFIKGKEYLSFCSFSKDEILTWLEKQGEQKHVEWRGEDEMFIHGLIRGLEAKRDIHGHTTFSSDCIDITETINWLKSLRPQNRWKPSDEQMEALANALSIAKNCGEESSFDLSSLYEQLKKLEG